MEGDIVQMGAYIGAGLACMGMGGAAMGVGNVAGNFLAGALRNPSAAAGQTATLFIGKPHPRRACPSWIFRPLATRFSGSSSRWS